MGREKKDTKQEKLNSTIQEGAKLKLGRIFHFDRFQNNLNIFTDNSFSQIDATSKDPNEVTGTNIQASRPITNRVKVKAGLFVKHDKHQRK